MAKKKKSISKKTIKKKVTKKKSVLKKATKKKTTNKKSSPYPFIYLGQGIAMARKYIDFFICFKEIPSKKAKKEIESLVPEIIDDFEWKDRIFIFGHHSFLQDAVKYDYKKVKNKNSEYEEDPKLPSSAQWEAFNKDIDQFISQVQKKYPIYFALKPIDEEYGSNLDQWHEWSVQQVISAILPLANDFKKIIFPIQYAAWLWYIWVEEKSVKEQKEIIKTLSSEQIKLLKKWEYLPKAEEKPIYDPQPNLEEIEKIIPTLLNNPTNMRVEDAFERAFPNRNLHHPPTLNEYQNQLEEKKEYGKVIELCKLVLADGAEFPSHWWTALANALLALKKTEEAKEAIRQVVWHLESYSPGMLMTCMDYHQAMGEKETEAMLYHAGRKWFTSFSYSIKKEQAASYGKAPQDLPVQFGMWFRKWIEPLFSIEKNEHPGHWLVWFEDIGGTVFIGWKRKLEEEIDRRNALYDQLEKSTNKKEQTTLVHSILEFKMDGDENRLGRFAYLLTESTPELAFLLYKHALEIEGKNGYKHKGGSFFIAAQNILHVALNYYPEGRSVALQLAVPWGHRHPAIFHNAACIAAKMNNKEEALFYTECAIKYGYTELKLLLEDTDLESIKNEPRFKKLIAENKK